MRNETSIRTGAPPPRVWAVMTDVERWPQWTPSVTRIEKLDEGELRFGSRVRIKQPLVPKTVWRVTALEPGRSFEWRTAAPGLRSLAGHRVEPDGDGTKITLWVEQTGLVAMLLAGRLGKLTRKYIHMEAEGLKRRCEVPD